MGINVRFTVAVIAIIAVGFGGSFYIFSSGLMDQIIIPFDKSKYIKQIDACIESKFIGNVGTSSFVQSLAESMKLQIEETDSEDTAKEILARLYASTNCEP
jgi:hypothetical protein